MRILLADDDIPMRDLHAAVLTAHGHEVTAAADGEEAWQRFRTSHGGPRRPRRDRLVSAS